MRLTVLNVAYPLAAVGWNAVGGAEQVLTSIDEALVRAGHNSLVIAMEGSSCSGTLHPIPSIRGPFDDAARARAQQSVAAKLREVLSTTHVDVLHFHGLDFDRYLPAEPRPMLATLHLPPGWYAPEVFQLPEHVQLQCVSDAQRLACPDTRKSLPVIPNGVPLDRFRPSRRKAHFALTLGRICPEKGVHHALNAAERAKVPLVVAGQAFGYGEHERYLHQELLPRMAGGNRFIGPVGLPRKRRLLAAARCLLVPSLAPETSSLVAMEALASGTPVIAFANGALPELIEHGRTGFIVKDEQEMAEALAEVHRLDPRECRRSAEERFDLKRTTDQYLAQYEALVRPRPTRRKPALRARVFRDPERLGAIEPEWKALFGRVRGASPFQSPQWVLPAVHFGRVGALATFTLWRGERLVGLLPLEESGDVLRPIAREITDRMDLLLDPEDAPDAASELLSPFWSGSWRALELEQLAESSPLLQVTPPPGAAAMASPQEVTPVLFFPEGAHSLAEVLPKGLQANLRTARNRAERLGPVRFESASSDTVGSYMDALFTLHQARWSLRGKDGVLTGVALQRLHRNVADAFASAGTLRLHALWIGSRVAAVFYGFADAERVSYYLGGFDPEFASCSPGALVLAEAIEQALRGGARAFDFLRGAEAYKYGWGAKDTWNHRRTFFAPFEEHVATSFPEETVHA